MEFIKMLEVEYKELDEKLDKLIEFIGTEEYKRLSIVHQFLLEQQKEQMDAYLATLLIRYNILTLENKEV